MCRYAEYGPYRDHYACFACRKSFKWPHDRFAHIPAGMTPKCPQCSGSVEAMGLDFKAPPKNDVKQWERVRVLAAHGVRYTSCGCDGPGYRPVKLSEVQAFLEERLSPTEGERLLRDIESRALAHPNR